MKNTQLWSDFDDQSEAVQPQAITVVWRTEKIIHELSVPGTNLPFMFSVKAAEVATDIERIRLTRDISDTTALEEFAKLLKSLSTPVLSNIVFTKIFAKTYTKVTGKSLINIDEITLAIHEIIGKFGNVATANESELVTLREFCTELSNISAAKNPRIPRPRNYF